MTAIADRPVVLVAGDLEATFHPAIGMVCASLRHRGAELLGQRDGLRAYAERGKTMGIPLLHPWANRLSGDGYGGVTLPESAAGLRRDEHGQPIHGHLAASPDWVVVAEDRLGVVARLDFAARPERLALFPFPHVLTVSAALSSTALEITTTLEATGGVAVPVAFGWHPYLQIPGVPRTEWVLDLPARRHLLVDGRGIPTGETEAVIASRDPLGETAYDDGYDELASPAYALEGGERRVTVHFRDGYPVTQVFAPVAADLVAFEPMTAPTDALRSGRGLRHVGPGERFTATFAVEVG